MDIGKLISMAKEGTKIHLRFVTYCIHSFAARTNWWMQWPKFRKRCRYYLRLWDRLFWWHFHFLKVQFISLTSHMGCTLFVFKHCLALKMKKCIFFDDGYAHLGHIMQPIKLPLCTNAQHDSSTSTPYRCDKTEVLHEFLEHDLSNLAKLRRPISSPKLANL